MGRRTPACPLTPSAAACKEDSIMDTAQGLSSVMPPGVSVWRDTGNNGTPGISSRQEETAAATDKPSPALGSGPQTALQNSTQIKPAPDSKGSDNNALPPAVEPDAEAVEDAVAQMNQFFESAQRKLEFNLDDSGEHMVIQIKDADGEVVKQIPSEIALELARRLGEVQGFLFEEQA